jgi:CTP:molybdopterin cytidylyltransferase MocA
VIGGLVLAAGEGKRFGGPKQLAELDGRPLLEHAIEAMVCVPAVERIAVVLGARADEIRERVDFLDAEPVVCEDWADGQSASLRRGLDALGTDLDAIVITLGDQPRITPQVIAMVLDVGLQTRAPATRAVYDGRPGHPVVLRRRLLPWLHELRGEHGARDLLSQVTVREVEAAHLCSADDVDTPEALDRLRG